MLITLWVNWLKPAFSRWLRTFYGGLPCRPVPFFEYPEAAARYLGERCGYTGDPLRGAVDFNIHPEVMQAAMENGTIGSLPIDCDDYALWAYIALVKMGAEAQIWTLRDDSLKWGHHVVCTYRWRGKCGVIDTNGHRYLPDPYPATICQVFSEIYAREGYVYGHAEPTVPPF